MYALAHTIDLIQVARTLGVDSVSIQKIAQRCVDKRPRHGKIIRFDYCSTVLAHWTKISPIESTVYQPLICVVLQGAKEVSAGSHKVLCSVDQMILVSHQLPVVSQIVTASNTNPYIAVIFPLDREKLRRFYEPLKAKRSDNANAALSCHPVGSSLLASIGRLLALDEEVNIASSIAPLIEDEIHIRLLHSSLGQGLARLMWRDEKSSQITQAIQLISSDLSTNPSISELAETVGMSKSALHTHFKAVTGMSPLAYSKELRLLKAQVFVRESERPIATIGYEVGYDSPAQFSREYSRRFTLSPSQDRSTSRL